MYKQKIIKEYILRDWRQDKYQISKYTHEYSSINVNKYVYKCMLNKRGLNIHMNIHINIQNIYLKQSTNISAKICANTHINIFTKIFDDIYKNIPLINIQIKI